MIDHNVGYKTASGFLLPLRSQAMLKSSVQSWGWRLQSFSVLLLITTASPGAPLPLASLDVWRLGQFANPGGSVLVSVWPSWLSGFQPWAFPQSLSTARLHVVSSTDLTEAICVFEPIKTCLGLVSATRLARQAVATPRQLKTDRFILTHTSVFCRQEATTDMNRIRSTLSIGQYGSYAEWRNSWMTRNVIIRF